MVCSLTPPVWVVTVVMNHHRLSRRREIPPESCSELTDQCQMEVSRLTIALSVKHVSLFIIESMFIIVDHLRHYMQENFSS